MTFQIWDGVDLGRRKIIEDDGRLIIIRVNSKMLGISIKKRRKHMKYI
jgi:hypothetical protein